MFETLEGRQLMSATLEAGVVVNHEEQYAGAVEVQASPRLVTLSKVMASAHEMKKSLIGNFPR